ncbi:MAG: response regulator, partial [Promethearchaeota archaeon]
MLNNEKSPKPTPFLKIPKSAFCGFFWIQNSGVPFFKWFSTEFYSMKWNQEDLFFSGFFSAVNSSGEVFFDGDILHYIEFEEYKIFSSRIQNKDTLVLITTKECPDSSANHLLYKMTEYFYDFDISNEDSITLNNNEVENQFLKFLHEVQIKDKMIKYQKPKLADIFQSLGSNLKNKSENRVKTKSNKNIKNQSNVKQLSQEELSSKLKKAEKQILDLEKKLGTLTSLDRSIGHSMNNILASMLGNVSLAQMDVNDKTITEETIETLNDAEDACTHAKLLTDQLLTIAKNIGRISELQIKTEEELLPEIHEIKERVSQKKILDGSGRILVMDDEQAICVTLKRMLSRIGYEVDIANSLEKSLSMYQSSLNKGNRYDAVILDLSELGGLGGFGALIWLKIDPNVTAIVSSGYANDPVFREFKRHGFQGVLKKP